jgi:hypothetical protein
MCVLLVWCCYGAVRCGPTAPALQAKIAGCGLRTPSPQPAVVLRSLRALSTECGSISCACRAGALMAGSGQLHLTPVPLWPCAVHQHSSGAARPATVAF